MHKIVKMPDRRLAEFNYKLICNILANGYIVSKWDKSVSSKCTNCNENHTSEHMLFNCQRIQPIWNQLSDILKINFTWKKVIFGYLDGSLIDIDLCRLISLILYTLYKCWIIENDKKQEIDIIHTVKRDLQLKWPSISLINNKRWSDNVKTKIVQNLRK